MFIDFAYLKKNLIQSHTFLNNLWEGSVLFLCDETHIYLIKRSITMPTHSGQLAFIGGYKKSGEISPWEVAIREFFEETSLPSTNIEFLGYLPIVFTARNVPIIPIFTKLKISRESFLRTAKSNGEWDLIIAYSWGDLFNENRWEFAWRHGRMMSPVLFHMLQQGNYYSTINDQENKNGSLLLWGATAQIVWSLLQLVSTRNPS